MSPGVEITRLGATDLDVEVPSRAQKEILRIWDTKALVIWTGPDRRSDR